MKDNFRSKWAILLSLLVHACLVLIIMLQKQHPQSPEPDTLLVEWVDVTEEKSKTAPPLQATQIVEQEEMNRNDVIPEKDYKLSRHNQDVLKETRALKAGTFQNKQNQHVGVSQQASTAAPSASDLPPPAQPETKVSDPVPSESQFQKLAAFKPTLYDNQFRPERLAQPSPSAISGGDVSQSDDYLKDVVAGSETLLKTREFIYYSYYSRIKSQLRQHWEPRIKEKIVKILRQGRQIASVDDKVTRLMITLDESGELVRIQVRDASGYNDLDDAAIDAFRAAAPFPNPPKGIVNNLGQIELHWDFVLET